MEWAGTASTLLPTRPPQEVAGSSWGSDRLNNAVGGRGRKGRKQSSAGGQWEAQGRGLVDGELAVVRQG